MGLLGLYHLMYFISSKLYLTSFSQEKGSGDSSVSMTRYWLDGRICFMAKVSSFLYSTWSVLALGPIQAPIEWVPQVLSPGIMQPVFQAQHSCPCIAEVSSLHRLGELELAWMLWFLPGMQPIVHHCTDRASPAVVKALNAYIAWQVIVCFSLSGHWTKH